MKSVELFVEILVEELPAIPFLKEFENFESKWNKALLDYEIKASSEFFYTPRRIVIYSKNFPSKTQDRQQEIFGPPVEIAFEDGDKTKNLKPAAQAFLKKNSIEKEALQFCQKNNKEVLYLQSIQKGKQTKELIPSILEHFLSSLHFGKTMYWGSVKESFIRPIRNIAIFLDKEFIKTSFYGLNAKPITLVHRDYGFNCKPIKDFAQYTNLLFEYGVILSQEKRKEIILDSIVAFEQQYKLKVEIDKELLDEVVAITESPKVLFGTFEKKFLQLPKEVIITSMKENQRYFAVYEDEATLSNHFVMVSNSLSNDDAIILRGNQKVLKARLEDAMFFYQNDLKKGLQTLGLEKLVFIENAGSMLDKTKRESAIAKILAQKYQDNAINLALLLECVELSKADLLSEMVYEFSNLQGLMGYYYALAMQKDKQVALGIKEQYLPIGENSTLPSDAFTSIIAMAHKLDNIFSLFAIGKIPTGSKDPFALRRAANGILRIIVKQNFAFNLKEDLKDLYERLGYKPPFEEKITEFFIERLEGLLEVNPSLLKSVLVTQEFDVCRIVAKIDALHFYLSKDKESFVSTFKRVANILKNNQTDNLCIDVKLLKAIEEKNLFEAYEKFENMQFENYKDQMEALSNLKPKLDAFFDSVMVNVEDEETKKNRIALVAGIYGQFLKIADIKEISF